MCACTKTKPTHRQNHHIMIRKTTDTLRTVEQQTNPPQNDNANKIK